MNEQADIWQFLAGTALFVYAMHLMEESLKSLAGRPFKKFLQRSTDTHIKAILSGTIVTAVLQSSSLVIVMILSFVGAGILNLAGAFAVTIGANLGTTMDSWLVAWIGFKLNLEKITMPLLATAFVLQLVFGKNQRVKNFTYLLIGFALLFLGLEWIKMSMIGFVKNVDFSAIQHWPVVLFVGLGILITFLIQSSSATVAITLAALSQSIISFDKAAAIVIGSELGTSIKFLIGSMGGLADKKRLALGNSVYNLVVVILSTVFLYPIIHVLQEVFKIKDPLIGLVSFQTGINVMGTLLALPFISKMSRWLKTLFDDDYTLSTNNMEIDHKVLQDDHFLKAAKNDLNIILFKTIDYIKAVVGIPLNKIRKTGWLEKLFHGPENYALKTDSYKTIKTLHGEWWDTMLDFQKDETDTVVLHTTNTLLERSQNILHAAKNVKDISHNIDEARASANDHLFGFYEEIKSQASRFFEQYIQNIEHTTAGTHPGWLKLLASNKEVFSAFEQKLNDLLTENKISTVDTTNTLNVLREIKNAQNALVHAAQPDTLT